MAKTVPAPVFGVQTRSVRRLLRPLHRGGAASIESRLPQVSAPLQAYLSSGNHATIRRDEFFDNPGTWAPSLPPIGRRMPAGLFFGDLPIVEDDLLTLHAAHVSKVRGPSLFVRCQTHRNSEGPTNLASRTPNHGSARVRVTVAFAMSPMWTSRSQSPSQLLPIV